jgi:hypothetical protein
VNTSTTATTKTARACDHTIGTDLWLAGKPRTACKNRKQRSGWDEVQASVDATKDAFEAGLLNTEMSASDVRLQDLRAGWCMWCRLCSAEECRNADQAHGFALAAAANDGGGNRPTTREALYLTAANLP